MYQSDNEYFRDMQSMSDMVVVTTDMIPISVILFKVLLFL
jgi:hypothetical protein